MQTLANSSANLCTMLLVEVLMSFWLGFLFSPKIFQQNINILHKASFQELTCFKHFRVCFSEISIDWRNLFLFLILELTYLAPFPVFPFLVERRRLQEKKIMKENLPFHGEELVFPIWTSFISVSKSSGVSDDLDTFFCWPLSVKSLNLELLTPLPWFLDSRCFGSVEVSASLASAFVLLTESIIPVYNYELKTDVSIRLHYHIYLFF